MVTLVKFFIWFFSAVPRGVAFAIGRILGRLLYWVLGSKRNLAKENLRRSYPDWSEAQIARTARGVFRTQGLFFAEILRVVGEAKDSPLDMIDCDPDAMKAAEELQSQGRGLLVLTGHINNYELLLTWAARKFPMTVITKQIKQPELDLIFVETRKRNNISILPRRGSYRDAVRALKKGGFLGFVLDQNMKKDEGVHVEFFGRPANTTPGLAMMSAHAGAPVLPVCLIRENNRYKVRVFPVIDPPADRSPETLQATTQLYSNVVEQMIREQPEGWIWMHRRWKTPPEKGARITRADGSVYHA